MFDLVAPVERVTGYDTHIPLFRLEMKYLPSVDKILAAVQRTLAHRLSNPERYRMTKKTFFLPDLGEGLPDAEIVEWHGQGRRHGAARRSRWCRWKPPRRWSRCPRLSPARCCAWPAAPAT